MTTKTAHVHHNEAGISVPPNTWMLQNTIKALGSICTVLFFGTSSDIVQCQPVSPCGGNSAQLTRSSPANTSLTFTWNAIPNAGLYEVEYGPLGGGSTTVQVGGANTGALGLNLTPGTQYTWRLRVNDATSGLWGSWSSPPCSFTPVDVVPDAGATNCQGPEVISGATVTLNYCVGAWAPATTFEYQISTDPALTGAAIVPTTTTSSYTGGISVSGLLPGTNYYWRVRGVNSGGAGSWSGIASFSTETVATSLTLKVFLQGPLNAGTLRMGDALRTAGYIPSAEPYTGLGSTHLFNSGSTLAQALLNTTGDNAIVDWVLIEARHGTTNAILRQWAALVQRDGDVVMPNGTVPSLVFPIGQVKIGVRHRNHLGVTTATNRTVNGTALTVDLTLTATTLYGTAPTATVNSRRALWAGDCNGDGIVGYTGANNDRDRVLAAIGGIIPTNFVDGYRAEDVSLSGRVLYTGAGNDRDMILSTIGGVIPTNTRAQQLP